MARRDARHGSRLASWLPLLLVLVLLVAGGTAYLVDRGPSRSPDPSHPTVTSTAQPSTVAPPPTLDLPALLPPEPVAATASGTAASARVRRAVERLLRDKDLGRHVLASVSDVDGTPVYSFGTGTVLPASTQKLLTSTAALDLLGPDHTFATRVVADGRGRIVLVGGGDPLLSAADLTRLARSTATALAGKGRRQVRIGYDASLFTGPAVSPRWEPGYVPEEVIPISALEIGDDTGLPAAATASDPAALAATVFAGALAKAGVTTLGVPEPRPAPKDAADAAPIAEVTSKPLDQLVEHTLLYSDNHAAEVLARHVGIAASGQGTFDGGAQGVLATIKQLGVPTSGVRLYDGSGLSRDNRVETDTIVGALAVAAREDQGDLRAVLTGLPVAGFTGTLVYRFEVGGDDGLGYVRAKTGTLSGVSGLAGTVTDRDGTPMLFAVIADRIALPKTLAARATLDQITSALAGCRCGSAGTVAP